jgi:SAM-dependent methyltransferase
MRTSMDESRPETTWGIGEYALMAERLGPAAEVIVEMTRVTARDAVLDLACGTGNAALLAARRGAAVTALDFEPTLLEIARARSEALELSVELVEADLQRPPFEPDRFDVVLSAFGIMYAPNHDAAAAALASSARSGARVALTAWTPGSFMPAMGAALAPYLPPAPPGGGPPSRWGDPDYAAELISRHGIQVRSSETRSLHLPCSSSEAATEFLIRTAGHVLAEQPRLEHEERWSDLRHDVSKLVRARSSEQQLELEYLILLAEHRPV